MLFKKSCSLMTILLLMVASFSVHAGNGKDLRRAARDGDFTMVRQLLEKGVNPDVAGSKGGTALIKAAKGGHIAIVQLLLFYGADPAKQNVKGRTAIDVAESNGEDLIATIMKDAIREQAVTINIGEISSKRFNQLMTAALQGRRWQIETGEKSKITAVYYRSARAYKVVAMHKGNQIIIRFLRGYGSNRMNYLNNLKKDLQTRL